MSSKGVLFNIFITMSTLFYVIASLVLALSPSFVAWKLILPAVAIAAWIIAYPYFKNSDRSPPFSLFFVSLVAAVVGTVAGFTFTFVCTKAHPLLFLPDLPLWVCRG